MREQIEARIRDHQVLIERAAGELRDAAIAIGTALADTFREGGRVFLFGNGGSAADAQHIAAELVNRFRMERPPLPALALTTDSSTLTAIANDYSFRDVFAKQLRAFGQPGDLAVGITTSGASDNIVQGLNTARELGMRTVALLGKDGGEARKLADIMFIAPHDDTARIQEAHLLLEHLICEVVEYALFIEPSMRSR